MLHGVALRLLLVLEHCCASLFRVVGVTFVFVGDSKVRCYVRVKFNFVVANEQRKSGFGRGIAVLEWTEFSV